MRESRRTEILTAGVLVAPFVAIYGWLFVYPTIQMVRLLLSQHANPNQTDNLSGNSAIDYARQDPRAAAILRQLQQPH